MTLPSPPPMVQEEHGSRTHAVILRQGGELAQGRDGQQAREQTVSQLMQALPRQAGQVCKNMCNESGAASAAAAFAPHTVPKPASVLICKRPTLARPPAPSTKRTSVLDCVPATSSAKAKNKSNMIHTVRKCCSDPQCLPAPRHGINPRS